MSILYNINIETTRKKASMVYKYVCLRRKDNIDVLRNIEYMSWEEIVLTKEKKRKEKK